MSNYVAENVLKEYDEMQQAAALDNIYEVDVITYEDCIAIMDAAIKDSCELEELRSSPDLRLALHCKAMRSTPMNTVRDSVTVYLGTLDPHSLEWDLWFEAYTEGELVCIFGVDI